MKNKQTIYVNEQHLGNRASEVKYGGRLGDVGEEFEKAFDAALALAVQE